MKTLCIYHGNCFDGFTAAWVVRKALGEDVEFHPGVYFTPPPNVKDRDVVIVDFGYKPEVMQQIINEAQSVCILDHHASAMEELADIVAANRSNPNFYAVFDMNRSGAGLAWDHFFTGQQRPDFVTRVEDRDLWRFNYEDTRFVHAAMSSFPFTFEAWDKIADTSIPVLAAMGADIDRKHKQDVLSLLPVVGRFMSIQGYVVPIANLPMTMTSDAGNQMLEDYPQYPFAGCYWDTPKGRVFSLRSRVDGTDVAAIAQKYGGGGHKTAAGFTVPFEVLRGEGLL